VFSEQSRQNLAGVFERAARSTMVRSQEDVCEIAREPAGAAASSTDPLLVITTSSFNFRLLTIFQVSDTAANRAYFLPAGAGCTIQEGFAEVANLCCGALNREISLVYPHLAMSVPSRLSPECLEYLAQLNPEYTSRFTVSINTTAKLAVTLCMCCTAPVDIPMGAATAGQSNGELEMF
jgi:hypothetical protein